MCQAWGLLLTTLSKNAKAIKMKKTKNCAVETPAVYCFHISKEFNMTNQYSLINEISLDNFISICPELLIPITCFQKTSEITVAKSKHSYRLFKKKAKVTVTLWMPSASCA